MPRANGAIDGKDGFREVLRRGRATVLIGDDPQFLAFGARGAGSF